METIKVLTLLIFSIQLFVNSYANSDHSKISVLISKYEPFVFFTNETESQGPSKSPKGLDISILNNFAKKFNLQIEYIQSNESLREAIVSEHKFKKMLENVMNLSVDILAGGLEETLVSQTSLVASQFYHHDYITWCVRKSRRLSFVMSFLTICTDPLTLSMCLIVIIVLWISAYVLQLFERPQYDGIRCFISGIAAAVGQSPAYHPTNTAHRIVLATVLTAGVIFSTIFTTYFILFSMEGTTSTQSQSITDILSKKFVLAGDRVTFIKMSQQHEIFPPDTLRRFKLCNDLIICLNELYWDENLAVAVSHERVKKYLLLSSSQIFCFDENESVHKYYMRFLINKEFRHLNQLNQFIQMASFSWLTSRWLDVNQIQTNFLSVEVDDSNDNGKFLITLTFVILPCFYLSSGLALFLERLVYRKAREPEAKKFWIYLELIIDADRHFLLNDLRYYIENP